MGISNLDPGAHERRPWNVGSLVGAKRPLKPRDVWAIRFFLDEHRRMRDNIVGAVVILPVLRHLTCQRDAVIAGIIAGPLTMLPAILFFVVMMAFYPNIGDEALPSDFLLRKMAMPGFHIVFQAMIFAALLESGAGALHAIHERIAHAAQARARPAPGPMARTLIGAVILSVCMFIAARIGLVDLIAGGYSFLAWVFPAVYIVPLLTIGSYRLLRSQAPSPLRNIP